MLTFTVGPLSGSFPLLSLRTNKADVVVGVPKQIADSLDAKGEKWRIDFDILQGGGRWENPQMGWASSCVFHFHVSYEALSRASKRND